MLPCTLLFNGESGNVPISFFAIILSRKFHQPLRLFLEINMLLIIFITFYALNILIFYFFVNITFFLIIKNEDIIDFYFSFDERLLYTLDHFSSSQISIPSSLALSALLPGLSPTMTTFVLLLTEPLAEPP